VSLSISARRRIATATLLAGVFASPVLRSQAPRPTFDVFEKSITELQNAMAAGSISSRQIVEQAPRAHDAYDQHGPSSTFISLNESARQSGGARREQAGRRAGRTAFGRDQDNYVCRIADTGARWRSKGFRPAATASW
jgi:hypothetical protein